MSKTYPAALILQTVQAAPAPGMEMLRALIQSGQVGMEDPVDKSGEGILDALIDRTLTVTLSKRLETGLFKGLFSPAAVAAWQVAAGPGVFARKDKKGDWIALSLLNTIDEAISANKQSQSGNNGKRKITDKSIPANKDIDQWLSAVLEVMPPAIWEENGIQIFHRALAMNLGKSTDLAWKHIPVNSPTETGLPLLCFARRADYWDRFIKEGGDPFQQFEGVALWKIMFTKITKGPSKGQADFLGSFENWLLENSPSNPLLAQAIQNLVYNRLPKADKTPVSRWMEMLLASNGWEEWQTSKKEPLWQAVAQSHGNLAFFTALEKDKSLLGRLDYSEFSRSRMRCVLRDLQADAPNAPSNCVAVLQEHGFAPSSNPCVLEFASIKMPPATRQAVKAAALKDPVAWWGAGDREEVEKQLLFSLPEVASKAKDHVLSWQAIAGALAPQTPWMRVGNALVSALDNKLDQVHALDAADIHHITQDPASLPLLEGLGKRVWTGHRKNYETWLARVRLECATPSAPSTSRTALRL